MVTTIASATISLNSKNCHFLCAANIKDIFSEEPSSLWYSVTSYNHHAVHQTPQNTLTLQLDICTLSPLRSRGSFFMHRKNLEQNAASSIITVVHICHRPQRFQNCVYNYDPIWTSDQSCEISRAWPQFPKEAAEIRARLTARKEKARVPTPSAAFCSCHEACTQTAPPPPCFSLTYRLSCEF